MFVLKQSWFVRVVCPVINRFVGRDVEHLSILREIGSREIRRGFKPLFQTQDF